MKTKKMLITFADCAINTDDVTTIRLVPDQDPPRYRVFLHGRFDDAEFSSVYLTQKEFDKLRHYNDRRYRRNGGGEQ